jgi:membrane glycosyltransferase
MNKIFNNDIFKFLLFFSILNTILLYGSSLYINYISIKNFHGIYLLSFIFFIVILFNISFGFTTILLGFVSKIFTTKSKISYDKKMSTTSKTAILFPVYNEDTSSVYSRIKVLNKFLKIDKLLNSIDIHILSDSNDLLIILKEEMAFRELESCFMGCTNLFYRRRVNNINNKSGNIADFCKRYGNNYNYMIIMDADSFMSISTIKKLIFEMDKESNLGLIQTYPQIIFPKTFFQIFSYIHSILSSELYVRGSEFWNRGNGPYWGHNSIVRINAFMNFCLLPKLPKVGPLGEKILSHDTIEASLLRQAGYKTKFMFVENSSFEEAPPTLIDAFKRDYRWCQGNLQHFWFIFINQFKTINRIYILLGIISYFAYFFWLLFLTSTVIINYHDSSLLLESIELSSTNKLKNLTIFISVILFFPRIISVLNYVIYTKKINSKILYLYLFDTILVIFSSSIYLLLISYFIINTILGNKIKWNVQRRKLENLQNVVHSYFYYLTSIGFLLTFLFYKFSYSLFFYFSPILIGLSFSIPISKFYDYTVKDYSIISDYNLRELNLLKLYISRGNFKYSEMDQDDPIYTLINNPKVYFIHHSFLRRKINNSRTSDTIIAKIKEDLSLLENSTLRSRIFNNIRLIEYIKYNIPKNDLYKGKKKTIKGTLL